MEWPSKYIPQGGILQPRKNQFSHETANFIKELLNESRLSIKQKDRFEYKLRTGEDFPKPKHSARKISKEEILISPHSPRRRSFQTIVDSGAYDREKCVPFHPTVDRQKLIQRLQDKMAFNKELDGKNRRTILKTNEQKKDEKPENRFDQLMREIKEREEWLKEMEKLGKGEQFKEIIQSQIQTKIREMKSLKKIEKSAR